MHPYTYTHAHRPHADIHMSCTSGKRPTRAMKHTSVGIREVLGYKEEKLRDKGKSVQGQSEHGFQSLRGREGWRFPLFRGNGFNAAQVVVGVASQACAVCDPLAHAALSWAEQSGQGHWGQRTSGTPITSQQEPGTSPGFPSISHLIHKRGGRFKIEISPSKIPLDASWQISSLTVTRGACFMHESAAF